VQEATARGLGRPLNFAAYASSVLYNGLGREQVEALDPRIVVAGHKRPDAPDDDPAAILGGTKTYIRDFERSLAGSHSAQGLVDKMMARHGDLGNPYTLWTAAQAVFEQGQGA
jgi:hypothetical protein